MNRKSLVLIVSSLLCGCTYFADKKLPDLWEVVTNQIPDVVVSPTNPTDTFPADEIDITKIKVFSATPDLLKTWPVNVGLKRCWRDNLWRWEYDRPCPWTKEYNGAIGNKWIFIEGEDGKWAGVPCDWNRKGQNYCRWGDIRFFSSKESEEIHPSKGQKFGFMTSTPARNSVARTGCRSNIKICVVE